MATVNPNTPYAGLALAQANGGSSTAGALQEQFMTLLVTQLRNQDPLNPMENAELTSQLAQISTVEGISNLKNTLLAIAGQIDVSQSLNAASLIGKGVMVPGAKMVLGTDPDDPTARVATPYGMDLQGDAAKVTIKISDSAGNVVRTITLENQKPGVFTYEWDGKNDVDVDMPDGAYSVAVEAFDAENKKVTADVLTYGKVNSVAYSTEGLRLDLGLNGQISMLDVRKVLGS